MDMHRRRAYIEPHGDLNGNINACQNGKCQTDSAAQRPGRESSVRGRFGGKPPSAAAAGSKERIRGFTGTNAFDNRRSFHAGPHDGAGGSFAPALRHAGEDSGG